MLWRTIFRDHWNGRSPADSEVGENFSNYLTFELCRGIWVEPDAKSLRYRDTNTSETIAQLNSLSLAANQLSNHEWASAADVLPALGFLSKEVGYILAPGAVGHALRRGFHDRLLPYRRPDSRIYADFERHTTDTLSQRAMFNTLDNRIGVGHRTIEPGDEIWLLEGGRVPFVLRRSQECAEGPQYSFIGESFVYGIMDGSAWPEDERLLKVIDLR